MAILHPRRPWRRAPRTVFVLGGGGNLGALQVGMLQAVLERGIVPDELVGCSAGALNAAMLASDPTADGLDKLRTLWMSSGEDIVAPFSRFDGVRLLTHRGVSLQSNDGLRRLVEANLPHRRFEDFPVPLHVVATSLKTNSERWFSSGPVVDPILASAALPAIFPPVEIEGDVLIDGGVLNNVPVSKAHQLNPDRIYVFHVGNFSRPRPVPKKPIDVLLQAFSISRSYRFETETRQPASPGVEVVVLPSVDPGKLKYNDFSHSAEHIERGRAATSTFLDTTAAVAQT